MAKKARPIPKAEQEEIKARKTYLKMMRALTAPPKNRGARSFNRR
jgi:hypothetical protein